MATTSKLASSLMEKIAAMRAAKEAAQTTTLATLPPSPATEIAEVVAEIPTTTTVSATDRNGQAITYNAKQQEAVNLISTGQSCVVIGAAGTGKTTLQKGSTGQLMANGMLPTLNADHKYLAKSAPGIAICAYTRRATNNIRRNMSADLQGNCITIHKLLEYAPEEIVVVDDEGKEKTSRIFVPGRNAENPLPPNLHTIIIEEASMVSVELFNEILAACPHNPQFVFLGDIQQLPPVFGSAILGYKMLELPVVELTEVYRQALESPILSLAYRILSGSPISKSDMIAMHVPKKLTLHPWKKKIDPDSATITLAKFFIKQLEQGTYNPDEDGILIPFNKSCGTDELNRHIATKIAQLQFKPVYEIFHSWKKSYYSVGDKCLYEKEDAVIKSIYPNPKFTGMMPRAESLDLDYWGHSASPSSDANNTEDVDSFLSYIQVGETTDGEKKQRAASHCIQLQLLDSERTVTISSAGELESLTLGYAITVHKSQGSEWDKVFLCFHHSHASMIQRELLYTAVTRAKQELFCICEADTFEKGILRQRIKGATWQEKAEYFKGKIEANELQS